MSLIELDNINFSYSDSNDSEVSVFQNFSLSLDKGHCLLLKGDNGSGKSTLFRILNGLSFPKSGQYIFDGAVISQGYLADSCQAKSFHKRIGYLFQNPELMLFNATVFDEIAFGPRQMGMSEEAVKERVEESLKLLKIDDLAERIPYHLSGGQKKKVALAAIISLNPDVYILDEPFASFDQKSQEWLQEFLQELNAAGKTLIIATHNDAICHKLENVKILDLG